MTDTVTSAEMVDTGASYRQVDYWSKQGYLRPENLRPGSGKHRRWPRLEYDVLRVMVQLVRNGMEPAAAASIARDAVNSGDKRVDLGGGIVISLEDPDPAPEPQEATA
jgi:DNA-binding transcriptional MerR regulator